MTAISAALLAGLSLPLYAQDDDSDLEELRKKLESISVVEQKVMVPMRDGIRLATNIYRPKDIASGKTVDLPTVFWRTPYNFNKLRKFMLNAIIPMLESGYAIVIQNERGKFFSEGEWEILGFPRTDGYDSLTWIAQRDWSNGKVGTIGCSSSAEWQLALAAMDHPAHAAMVPQASGAGIGRVGDYYEQGNWYRGGVYQMLFGVWLYGVQNTQRPLLPTDLSHEDRVRLSKYFDLAPEMPEVDWPKALEHLPLVKMMREVEGPKGTYSELIQRFPNDPAWYEGGLYHDSEPWGVPALWMNSWYDVSIGPNLELFQHATENGADDDVRDNQFMVVAPVTHCAFTRAKEETIVGERNMGDARFDYRRMILDWFDLWLKGEKNGFGRNYPKVRYYTMGANEWKESKTWPPKRVEMETWLLGSGGKANSLFGDGVLVRESGERKRSKRRSTPTSGDKALATTGVSTANSDTFPYDPMNPVVSLGGGVCCTGDAVQPGSFDQREREARYDILVYTSEPLEETIEVTGPIEATLYVSSSAKDTDFSVKLIDVLPDGTAYNLDETIQRARYREGYDKQLMMAPGEVYELKVSPMSTSNTFEAGHRIRIEVSSSNFPRFARNLNTGGNNYDETEPVVAINTVHHSAEYPSYIKLPVIRR
ncbi:MAG: CocE/NonD family hydrolase [Acidobacteriota bacterium]|nr:CocE/NonD family hydrolase [Acidobacteriota bacterium]